MNTGAERVYEKISRMIRDGDFTAGQPLREATIAEALNVSRTPVREALRRMATEGTVELVPNKGATLVEFSPEDVADIWALRAILEPYAAKLAADRANEDQITDLEEIYEDMREALAAQDLDLLTDLNNEFHSGIVDAGGSRVLKDALAGVRKKALVRRTFGHYTPDQLIRSQQHHRDLIDAIRAGNGNWAESTMRAHIEAGQEV